MYPFPPADGKRQQISIFRDFAPTALQIYWYMEERCVSQPFLSAVQDDRHRIKAFLAKCISKRTSRTMRATGRSGLDGRPEMELDYLTLTGLHGLTLRISDIYSLLGFIITETEPYPENPGETTAQKDANHLAILAHYTKWIDILANSGWWNGTDSFPSSTCIMWVRTAVNSAEGTFIPMAVFPNLSGSHKYEALHLQQQNIQGFINGLKINGVSPRVLEGVASHFGHCAEILALLYMLDPLTASQCFLRGAAAETAPLHAAKIYDPEQFRKKMKKACANCQYMLRRINEKMGKRAGDSNALQYYDMVHHKSFVPPGPEVCARRACPNQAWSNYECSWCRVTWYCSSNCKKLDAPEHDKICVGARWKKCNACGNPGKSFCGGCQKVEGRIPAMYCQRACQVTHWPKHKAWCENRFNVGGPPGM
ncbi:hypothetical protein B0H16DRAFT_1557021 [Mycena metata]|uniref:MYND-type domain-containing protein n=1 Tax=Mycena metata TaxID=1033252 RepID=A0AAD7IPX6_9AGAR|nr:hypothetical protein B0H16DRAFT_1557021 [Mycena metata]